MTNQLPSEPQSQSQPQSETHQTMNNNINPDNEPDLHAEPPAPIFKPGVSGYAFALLTLMLVLILLYWMLSGLITAVSTPTRPAREDLGTLQRITYIGGLGSHTQIDTERQTLLLRGTVILTKGHRLERRERFLESEVCDLDNGDCWELLGR